MPEDQAELPFEIVPSTAPVATPELRDEVATVWGLPLGQRVEVCFRGSDRSAVTGKLELVSTPAYPWDAQQPLRLQIAGFVFSSREIDRWTLSSS